MTPDLADPADPADPEATAGRRDELAALPSASVCLIWLPLGPDRFVIEMTPVWGNGATDRGVVRVGAVGARWLGVSRLFRYEVRCWPDGQIGDVAEATGRPEHVSCDLSQAQALLACVPQVPAATWGRDELGTGEMWNSNSLVAWLLARSGHDMATVVPPSGGRAPGWDAGLVLAGRDSQPIAVVDHGARLPSG